MLASTTTLTSLSPENSIQSISRVKPLELTPSQNPSVPQGVVPNMPVPQPLQEVSIHKTVIPPRTLSPPLCPSLCRAQGPPSSLPGHPREGQSASLLGGKYVLLDELEGSSLHRCLDINSQEELVCKVRYRHVFQNTIINKSKRCSVESLKCATSVLGLGFHSRDLIPVSHENIEAAVKIY